MMTESEIHLLTDVSNDRQKPTGLHTHTHVFIFKVLDLCRIVMLGFLFLTLSLCNVWVLHYW